MITPVFSSLKNPTKPGTLKEKDALKQFPPIISAIFWHNLAHHEEITQMLCTLEKEIHPVILQTLYKFNT